MQARLIYVVGASGSGKDSLISRARQALQRDSNVQFAHRYITRLADAGGENHVALTSEEFKSRSSGGLFAMQWSSHGYEYGIGIEIDQWLANNITVVVNGSRGYLQEARLAYPNLMPVCVQVSPEVLRNRLGRRGRETDAEIEARLLRHESLGSEVHGGVVIDNDQDLDKSSAQFCQLIESCKRG